MAGSGPLKGNNFALEFSPWQLMNWKT